jgi:hypothetical protein
MTDAIITYCRKHDAERAEIRETLKRIEEAVDGILDKIMKPDRRHHDPAPVVLPPIVKIPV